jgi:hypothetical protein
MVTRFRRASLVLMGTLSWNSALHAFVLMERFKGLMMGVIRSDDVVRLVVEMEDVEEDGKERLNELFLWTPKFGVCRKEI